MEHYQPANGPKNSKPHKGETSENKLEKRCEQNALFLVHWPGQTIAMCTKHTEHTQATANAMGFTVTISISTAGQCQCHETKK